MHSPLAPEASSPTPGGLGSAQRACLVNGFALTVLGLALLWGTPSVLVNLFILGIGLSLFMLGLEVDDGRWLIPLRARGIRLSGWLGVSPVQALLLLDGLLLALGGASASGDEPLARSAVHGWLWVGGILLTTAGLWNPAERPRLDRRSALPLALGLGIALLALAARMYRLDSLPYAVNGDEGSGGLMGLEFLRATRSNLFGTAWHSFPSFYFWLVSLSQAALGPTLLAARLPSAVAGALAVLATYWAGTRLFGRTHGMFAALLLAGSHVHLMFSRVAINNVWDGFFLALLIGSIWVAWTTNARWAFLLAGLAVGLGQLFYPTSRLLVLAVPLWLLILRMARPSPGRGAGILSLVLMGLVTILPLALFFAGNPNEFVAPLSGVAVSDVTGLLSTSEGLRSLSLGSLPTQFWTSALGLVVLPIRGIYHPEQPMLLPLTAVLFCLGFLVLLSTMRDPRSLILISAILGALLAGTLSVEAPNGHRMQGVLPVLALIAACTPLWILEQVRRFREPVPRRLAAACLMAGVAFVAATEARFFLVDAIPGGAYGDRSTYASRVIGDFAATLPEGSSLVLFGEPRLSFANFPSLHYLIRGLSVCDGRWPLPPDCAASSGPRSFIFLAEQYDALESVRAAYPSGRDATLQEMPGNPPIKVWLISE